MSLLNRRFHIRQIVSRVSDTPLPQRKIKIQNFETPPPPQKKKKKPEPTYVWKYQSTPTPPLPLWFECLTLLKIEVYGKKGFKMAWNAFLET